MLLILNVFDDIIKLKYFLEKNSFFKVKYCFCIIGICNVIELNLV